MTCVLINALIFLSFYSYLFVSAFREHSLTNGSFPFAIKNCPLGIAGSTPLHFAAANGHLAVVRLLLSHGAVPDRADKHGVTPEDLARENGWIECADMLRAWSGSRAGDLPPVDPNASTSTSGYGSTSGGRESLDVTGDGIGPGSKRLHVKHSLDNALHLFKASARSVSHHASQSQLRDRDRPPPSPSASSHAHSHSGSHTLFHHHIHAPHFFHHSHSASPPSSTTNLNVSAKPLGEYTYYPTPGPTPVDDGQRRPSLPQIFGDDRFGSSSSSSSPYYVGGGRGGAARARRPRSAGSDSAAQENEHFDIPGFPQRSVSGGAAIPGFVAAGSVAGLGSITQMGSAGFATGTGTPKKLGSKISLRNLFRRANVDSPGVSMGGGPTGGSEPASGTGSASTSLSSSPAAGPYTYTHTHQQGPYTPNSYHQSPHRHRRAPSNSVPVSRTMSASPSASTYSSGSALISASLTPPASPSGMSFAGASGAFRARMHSEGAYALPAPRSPLVKDAELSDTSDNEDGTEQKTEREAPQLSSRPSILRGHKRSASSQSQSPTGTGMGMPTMRTLRFDASASPLSSSATCSSNGPPLPMGLSGLRSDTSAVARGVPLRVTRSASSLRHGESIDDEEDEDEEEDYGTTIDSGSVEHLEVTPDSALPGIGPRTARFDDSELEALELELSYRQILQQSQASRTQQGGSRHRGASFTSTASSSPGVAVANGAGTHGGYGEFPFSISHVPTTAGSGDISPSQQTTDSPMPENERGGSVNKTRMLSPSSDSRARGDSVSSVDTSASAQSSSASAAPTSVTTPSPGGELMPSVTDVLYPRQKQRTDGKGSTYLAESSESSLEDLNKNVYSSPSTRLHPEKAADTKPSTVPLELDLRGISNLAEAEALAARARSEILASAALPADGPGSPDVSLSSQLAAYGAILALEKRFAKGEKQKERWDREKERAEASGEDGGEEIGLGMRSGVEDGSGDVAGTVRVPQSAKEARMMAAQRRKEAVAAMRQASSASVTTSPRVPIVLGPVPTRNAPRSPRSATTPTRTPRVRRPHTAEGPTTTSAWTFAREFLLLIHFLDGVSSES